MYYLCRLVIYEHYTHCKFTLSSCFHKIRLIILYLCVLEKDHSSIQVYHSIGSPCWFGSTWNLKAPFQISYKVRLVQGPPLFSRFEKKTQKTHLTIVTLAGAVVAEFDLSSKGAKHDLQNEFEFLLIIGIRYWGLASIDSDFELVIKIGISYWVW